MDYLRFTGRVFVETYSYPLTESGFRYIKLFEMFFTSCFAVGLLGPSQRGLCPERNEEMSDSRQELAELLLSSFEDEGVTPQQIRRIASSPEIIRGTIGCADGEMEFVQKRVREKTKEERVPRSNIVSLSPVISCGEKGDGLLNVLEDGGVKVGELAQAIIQNPEFVSSTGVTYKPVMVIGDQFSDNIVTSNVRKFAVKMKYAIPPVELAPLLRISISNEEMEKLGLLWIIIMHRELVGTPGLLGLDRSGGVRLHAYVGGESRRWLRKTGFVYLAPQEQ